MVGELDFKVIDEDSSWIVVEKPAHLVVHPCSDKEEPTLLGGLQALLACDLADGSKLSILTRLDRETSGLVLVAKKREIARELSTQFEARSVRKEYLALVHGWPAWESFECEAPILRAGEVGDSEVWVRQAVHPGGKASTTDFSVEERVKWDGREFAWIRCIPKSGRMHQIRVHLEYLGHPIVGDKIYGTDGEAYLQQVRGGLTRELLEQLILPRHALHATRLTISWKGHSLSWESGLPADLARFSGEETVGIGHG